MLVHSGSRGNVGRAPKRISDVRTVAGGVFEFQAHRFKQNQDIGKEDSGIDSKSLDGGEHDIGCMAWAFAQFEESHLAA